MSYKGKSIDDILKIKNIKSIDENVNLEILSEGDDGGVSLTGGQFGVGSPDNPKESVFGGGDSYPVNIAFHYSTDNESGNVIISADDITEILRSDSDSSVTLFRNNLANEVILVGSDTPFFGVKIKYDSLGDVEPDRIVAEFYDNVGDWIEDGLMTTKSAYPLTRAGWRLASFDSEHVRFGDNLIPTATHASLMTLNINGTNITKYWGRIRLLSPITTQPLVQQVKQHPSRFESNSDGSLEFFGKARRLIEVKNQDVANSASDPANENVVYFSGGVSGARAKYLDNEFANGTTDSRMLIVKLDDNIDTSTPLLLTFIYYVKYDEVGDVELVFEYQQLTSDFRYNTIVDPEGTITKIDTVGAGEQYLRKSVQVEIPVNKTDITVGGVVVCISRDASSGNPNDTLASSIIITGTNVKALSWK